MNQTLNMKNKEAIKDAAYIILLWLMALALAFLVILKIKIFIH